MDFVNNDIIEIAEETYEENWSGINRFNVNMKYLNRFKIFENVKVDLEPRLNRDGSIPI